MCENKNEQKKTTTNEELLDHLKEIEVTQGCILNSFNTIFWILYSHKDNLDLSGKEIDILEAGMIALTGATSHINDVSGIEEKVKKRKKKKLTAFWIC